MANNRDARIEDNLRTIAESYKKLDTIDYDKIVDLLEDEETFYQISLYVYNDVLTDTDYCVASILENNDTSTNKEYLLPDQDVNELYTNMNKVLKSREADTYYQMLMYGSIAERLACLVGKNELLFPRNITKVLFQSLKDDARERVSNKEDYISCLVGSKDYYILGTLVNEDTKKPKIFND